MPRLTASLSFLFKEVDFLDRFGAAAAAGFNGVEFMAPYPYGKAQLGDLLSGNGLELVLFNLPAGDWEAGERGLGALPDRVGEFQDGVGAAIGFAKALGCRRLNCLAGNRAPGVPEAKLRETLVENLRFAAEALQKEGIRLTVEPVNNKDVPAFYLTTTAQAMELFDQVAHPNLWLQYDIYHAQMMEGDLTATIRTHLPRIGHMQLADVPGRHEPGSGEIHFPNLFQFIEEAGYDGWIGCEYNPAGKTEQGLAWAAPFLTPR